MLQTFEQELIAAKPIYRLLSPSPKYLIHFKYPHLVRAVQAGFVVTGVVKSRREGKKISEITGEMLAQKALKMAMAPARAKVVELHMHMPTISHDFHRKNGIGGRSWITTPGQREMVVVYHNANRAGPHIDVHIGRLSVVYRVKPELQSQLKFHRTGYLTAASQELLMDHVREEIAKGARVPQNIDHSMTNARSQWVGGDPNGVTYGSGVTRQIVSVSPVEVYKAYADGPIEMYAPILNSSRPLYMYRLGQPDGKRAPIIIWGTKVANPPNLEERLHLKLVHPEDLDSLGDKADMDTSTVKYDGSSAYFAIGPKGTTIWSPRQSKRHGEQIDYTAKMRGLQETHHRETVVGMGEVMFVRKAPWYRPGAKDIYLPQSQGSGLLNSNSPLPRDIKPVIRIYRIDKVGRKSHYGEEFWENRRHQEAVAALNPELLKVVDLASPQQAKAQGFEGVVFVPPGGSVIDGSKVKWWTDPHDWLIEKVAFETGPKGKVAGVIHATSLESGRAFKLGPGQVGNEALTRDMMAHPHKYEGGVIKVQSRHGHEGRASKLLSFHDDKGVSVYD